MMAIKLNLGCGNRKMDGFVNVDKYEACHPDCLVDLEKFPWPWQDNAVDEVLLWHILEHLGESTATFLAIMGELWRVCADGARITIIVPHHRHGNFVADPTHVRAITPDTIRLFSQEYNRYCIANNLSDSLLGMNLGIDFAIESAVHTLEEPWNTKYSQKLISDDDLKFAIDCYNNVVKSTTIVCRAKKNITR